ncbi:MAG TPA: hypothetical protein VIC28_07705 [Thermoanaerobaculia bacterium]
MATQRSFEDIYAWLDAQIAHDREREAFHAQQEGFHREQRALFAAELEKLTAIRESFTAAADAAMDLASRAKALPPPAPSLDIGPRKPSLTKMVARIVEVRPAGEVFGPALITREINRHYRERLKRPVERKLVSIVLRRMAADGRIRSVRPGKQHQEAQYARKEG